MFNSSNYLVNLQTQSTAIPAQAGPSAIALIVELAIVGAIRYFCGVSWFTSD